MSDSILEGFGDPIVEIDESEFEHKLKKLSPFDFANSLILLNFIFIPPILFLELKTPHHKSAKRK